MGNEIALKVNSEEETIRLGEKLGRLLAGGEVIELISDLGGGKTTFTKGLARGIGSTDMVSSPTFTISNVYEGPELTLHHYDFYRLGELGLMSEELIETMADPKAVAVMEWADNARNILPEARSIRVYITLSSEEENARELRIQFGNALERLREKLA